MRLAIALALTAACLAATPAHAATPHRGIQLAPVFVDTDISGVKKELDLARKARLNLVKFEVNWSQLEPEPGVYSDEYLERIGQAMTAAATRRLKVMLMMQTTPCWTDTNPAGGCIPERGSDYPPADSDAYGRTAALLADRFGSRMAAFEIWNEPDHTNEEYWKGDDKVAKYAELVRATYSKVKDADSGVQVLAGSMVGASGEFLNQLYDAGIEGSYDGISVHYYDLSLAGLRSIRYAQKQRGDKKPVWLTEFGYTSCYPTRSQEEGHACVSKADQGKFLLDIFQAIQKTKWVRGAVIYNTRDTDQYKFGLASPTFEPKPALKVLADAFGRRKLGAPRKIKLREGRRGVTGTAPVGDKMKLQAYRGSCARQKQGAKPRYETDSMGLVRGRFNWKISALKRGKWCIYAQQYWTGREGLFDLT